MSAISAFADDLLWDMLRLSPDLSAELGLGEVNDRGLPVDKVVDFSDEAGARRRALMDSRRADFARLSTAGSTPDDRVTWQVLRYLLDDGAFGLFAGAAGRGFAEVPYPVNHLSGWHPSMLMMMVRDSVIEGADDARAYLDRLSALPAAIDGVIAALAAREAEAIVAPEVTLRKSLADLRAFVATGPDHNPLITAFRSKVLPVLGPASTPYVQAAERLWTDRVAPAYARLIDAVETQVARAGGDAGYWRLPKGEDWYAWALRSHTTTDLTPDEVHAIGLEEIDRVQARIRSEFKALGIEGDDIANLYAAISGPEHLAFAGHAPGRDKALAQTTELIERLDERSKPLFERSPSAAVEVELIAPEAEDSLHSHYTPPAPKSGRPGRFSFNLKAALGRPSWEVPVLCAHETTPGHHTQLALAQDLPLCAFRRTVVFTAYIEGWAKYAETLLDHELMDDPYVRLGRLRGELYSSVNLALDTGVHAHRWSLDQAERFFVSHTGVDTNFARSIVERCLVWPGQLTAYKVGMLKMLQVRDRLAARPGGGGVKAFHSHMLNRGALPLSMLGDGPGESTAGGGMP